MNQEVVKSCFINHPDAQEFHVTTDDVCFFHEHDAQAYVNGIPEWKNQPEKLVVTKVTRAEAMGWGAADTTSEAPDAADEAGDRATADSDQPAKPARKAKA